MLSVQVSNVRVSGDYTKADVSWPGGLLRDVWIRPGMPERCERRFWEAVGLEGFNSVCNQLRAV